jgi:hypothetical protein
VLATEAFGVLKPFPPVVADHRALANEVLCGIADLQELRALAEQLLQEDRSAFRLPEAAVVFSMYQGHQFKYFVADGSKAAREVKPLPPTYQPNAGLAQGAALE